VKQIIIPAILAMGIHVLLLEMDFNWYPGRISSRPRCLPIHLDLTCLPSRTQPPKAAVEKPAAVQPRPVEQVKPSVAAKREKNETKKIRKPKSVSTPKPKPPPGKQPAVAASSLSVSAKPQPPPPAPEPQIPPEPGELEPEPVQDTEPVTLFSPADQSSQRSIEPLIREAKPLYRENPPPVYPTIARRKRYQGLVWLEVLVDTQGRVADIRIHQSCGYDVLDRAALSAAQKWRFEPGKRGDTTVQMWVRIPVRFQLR
jgi:protein TonB